MVKRKVMAEMKVALMSTTLLENPQASPASPSDKDSMKVKTLGCEKPWL
jgi:hypothetical protein